MLPELLHFLSTRHATCSNNGESIQTESSSHIPPWDTVEANYSDHSPHL